MMPDEDRERLRGTFNGVARSYDGARPHYPPGLFDDLIALAGLAPGDHLLYDAESYIGLLSTFSGHIAMEQWKQDRLYGEIRRRLGRQPGHSVRRHWGAVLHVARRRDRPAQG
jgi:hypothetical protein